MFGKKIILVGAGASGKDYFRQNFQKHLGLKFSLSCTTREPREGEIDGKDYKFIPKEMFESFIKFGNMLQYAEFNGEFYGTTKDDFNECDLFIMSPDGIAQMSPEDRKLCSVVFIFADAAVTYDRFLQRGFSELQIGQRLVADEKLFSGFNNYDYIIVNNFKG